jgi:UDP-N-acetylglucosamine:LPS N-acetylglucosamine transferase
MKNAKIAIFCTSEGHLSIAEAIKELLDRQGHTTELFLFEDSSFLIYKFLYRFAPSLCLLYYRALFSKNFRYLVSYYTKFTHQPELLQAVSRFSPDLIVCTSYGFDSSISEYIKEKPTPYVNVITDPKTYFLANVSASADVNCVFDEVQQKDILDRNSQIKAEVTGWFVRSQFTPADKNELRRSLHLQPDVLTFLVASGSEGGMKVTKILPSLLESSHPLQIVVACGSNTYLFNKVEKMAQKFPDKIFPLKFTEEIHKYVQAADLVIGKAGPNTIFESVATHTPFFAITHVSGQENGNLDLIRDQELGFVEENITRANEILLKIINQPEMLERFRVPIQKMAQYNQQSSEKFLKIIERLLSPKSSS